MLQATVSGSFHRHMTAVYSAVGELRAIGVNVLSPSDPRVVDHLGEFLFVASDKLRSVKLVQDRHFESIRCSDFLWVVCPDGYIGSSTSAEIGAATICRTPVFSDHTPLDFTLQHYVRRVKSVSEAVSIVGRSRVQTPRNNTLLIDPSGSVEDMHRLLDELKMSLSGREIFVDGEIEGRVSQKIRSVRETIGQLADDWSE